MSCAVQRKRTALIIASSKSSLFDAIPKATNFLWFNKIGTETDVDEQNLNQVQKRKKKKKNILCEGTAMLMLHYSMLLDYDKCSRNELRGLQIWQIMKKVLKWRTRGMLKKKCRLKLNDLIKKGLEVKGGRTTKTFSLSGRIYDNRREGVGGAA